MDDYRLNKHVLEFQRDHGSCLDWVFDKLDSPESLGYSFGLIRVSWFINPYFDDETFLGREVGGWFGYDSKVIWGTDARPIKKYKNRIKLRKLAYDNLIKSSNLGVANMLLDNISTGFRRSFVEYREFQSLYFFLERLYFLRVGRRLGFEDLANVYFGGLDELLTFYLKDFDEVVDWPVYDASFFVKLNKLKYPDNETTDFFYKSRKIINKALKRTYKDSNTSTLIDAEENLIFYLAGCSAVFNERAQIIVVDILTAYETYYKLLRTDVTRFKCKIDIYDEQKGGFLVCDNCGEYYKLQPDESVDNYSDICRCGGKLRYYTTIKWLFEGNDGNNFRIKLKTMKMIYFITLVMFIVISGLYLAYSFSPSTDFLITIIFTILIGAALGLMASFKLTDEKNEYLIIFAFLLAATYVVIFTLMTGISLRGLDLASLTSDKYSLVLKSITVVTGIMGFITGCFLNAAIKKSMENRKDETKNNGYLVCDKCGEYYQLQPNESPDDFSDACECGGKLGFKETLESD